MLHSVLSRRKREKLNFFRFTSHLLGILNDLFRGCPAHGAYDRPASFVPGELPRPLLIGGEQDPPPARLVIEVIWSLLLRALRPGLLFFGTWVRWGSVPVRDQGTHPLVQEAVPGQNTGLRVMYESVQFVDVLS
jgi:hypothetical protein